jgi:hypothetical protein
MFPYMIRIIEAYEVQILLEYSMGNKKHQNLR